MPRFLSDDPTRCHLWSDEGLTAAAVAGALEPVLAFASESHLTKSLRQCKSCGQLYFHVWFELVDWDDGDDQMCEFYIPVTSRAEIERLTEMPPPPTSLALLDVFPRLQIGNSLQVTWAGKTGAP
jgi:hypothetical protein